MSVQVPPNSTGAVVATYTQVTGIVPVNNLGEVQQVSVVDGGRPTYSACYTGQSVGTAATTAIFYLGGSATKTVRLLKLIVGATIATAGEEYDFTLQKESVLPTGGTKATTATIVPWDSLFPAGTAAPAFYTATPTDGTVTGVVLVAKLVALIAVATTVLNPSGGYTFDFGTPGGGSSVVLRGAAQGVVATINAATPAHASSWSVTFVWSEDNS